MTLPVPHLIVNLSESWPSRDPTRSPSRQPRQSGPGRLSPWILLQHRDILHSGLGCPGSCRQMARLPAETNWIPSPEKVDCKINLYCLSLFYKTRLVYRFTCFECFVKWRFLRDFFKKFRIIGLNEYYPYVYPPFLLQSNGPCSLVLTSDHLLVVDCWQV